MAHLELSAEDLAKVQRNRRLREPRVKVNDTWLFIAEFGYYFGWEGIKALRFDKSFSMDEAEMLLKGARKVWASKVYDSATASFIGSASAQAKKPVQAFKKATSDIIKQTKVDA